MGVQGSPSPYREAYVRETEASTHQPCEGVILEVDLAPVKLSQQMPHGKETIYLSSAQISDS